MEAPYKVGFTGTRAGMTNNQKVQLKAELASVVRLGKGVIHLEFHHGNCVGSDEEAAQMARDLGFRVVAHPPVDTRLMSTFVSDETREPKQFLDRNHEIVDECNELLATPKEQEEVARSGTWATIRYARPKLGIMVKVLLP